MIWRGEVYKLDLGQPIGHEPGFARPAVVVSADILNNGSGGLVVVVPITSAAYGLRSHVEVEPGVSGLDHTSYARGDQLRVMSNERLACRLGRVRRDELRSIDQALRFVLDLWRCLFASDNRTVHDVLQNRCEEGDRFVALECEHSCWRAVEVDQGKRRCYEPYERLRDTGQVDHVFDVVDVVAQDGPKMVWWTTASLPFEWSLRMISSSGKS
jgi:mRNA interferase MazF